MASNVNIQPGMNILDAAIASGGSMEDVFALCFLNGKSITSDLVPGTNLQATGKQYAPSVMGAIANPTIDTIKVIAGQTLLDMAMQQLGSMDAVFSLAKLNGLSVTQQLADSQILNFSIMPFNRIIAKEFKDNGWKPASATTTSGVQTIPVLEGVDYWGIEIDFEVN